MTASSYRRRHKGEEEGEDEEASGGAEDEGEGRGAEEGEGEDGSIGAGGSPAGMSKDSVRKSTWLPLCFPGASRKVTLSSALHSRTSESEEDEDVEDILRKELLSGAEVGIVSVSDDEGDRTSG